MEIARNERHWAADAWRDRNYNLQKYQENFRKGNFVLARNYLLESQWDSQWRQKRLGIARRNTR
jgi:hypothetical protein